MALRPFLWGFRVLRPRTDFMASSQHGSVERGAGSAQGGTPGSPPRPMQGRVGDGPAGAGACFVGGFLSVAAPTSRHSFRYSGPRPPPSGQTQPESGSGEEDEEEEGEGEEDEDDEGSGDDNEARWDPETHGGGKGGDDEEDHEMDGLEPEEVEEGVGEGGGGAATEAASQHVAEGGGSVGVKVGIKRASIRMPKRRKRASKLRERAYPCTFTGKPLGEGVVAPEFLDEDGESESRFRGSNPQQHPASGTSRATTLRTCTCGITVTTLRPFTCMGRCFLVGATRVCRMATSMGGRMPSLGRISPRRKERRPVELGVQAGWSGS
ncbi:unnamed protein product [Closterium sp. NIES-54]